MTPLVHDGDTLRCGTVKLRIANIDAPELPGSPKCNPRTGRKGWCDTKLGAAARDALIALMRRAPAHYRAVGTDPYGRTLAVLYVGDTDAGAYLIAQGLARPWR